MLPMHTDANTSLAVLDAHQFLTRFEIDVRVSTPMNLRYETIDIQVLIYSTDLPAACPPCPMRP